MKYSRADKLGRMVSLVKLQLRLSEWQLGRLRQQEQELQDEETYLVGTFNEARLPTGSSGESISRRLAATSVGARAIQAQASRQLDLVQAEGRRVKQLERVAKAATASKLRDVERRSLEEMPVSYTGMHDWKPAAGSRNRK
jgi:hypothetical protein